MMVAKPTKPLSNPVVPERATGFAPNNPYARLRSGPHQRGVVTDLTGRDFVRRESHQLEAVRQDPNFVDIFHAASGLTAISSMYRTFDSVNPEEMRALGYMPKSQENQRWKDSFPSIVSSDLEKLEDQARLLGYNEPTSKDRAYLYNARSPEDYAKKLRNILHNREVERTLAAAPASTIASAMFMSLFEPQNWLALPLAGFGKISTAKAMTKAASFGAVIATAEEIAFSQTDPNRTSREAAANVAFSSVIHAGIGGFLSSSAKHQAKQLNQISGYLSESEAIRRVVMNIDEYLPEGGATALDVNKITLQGILDLKIKGIGRKRAQALVDEIAKRTQKGPITANDLDDISLSGLPTEAKRILKARLFVDDLLEFSEDSSLIAGIFGNSKVLGKSSAVTSLLNELLSSPFPEVRKLATEIFETPYLTTNQVNYGRRAPISLEQQIATARIGNIEYYQTSLYSNYQRYLGRDVDKMGEVGAGRTGTFFRGIVQAGKNIATGQNLNYSNITTPKGFMNIEEFEQKAVMLNRGSISKEELGEAGEFIQNISNDIDTFYSTYANDVKELYEFIHGKSPLNRKAPKELRERYWRSMFPELKGNKFKIKFVDENEVRSTAIGRDPNAPAPAAFARHAKDGTSTVYINRKLLQAAFEKKAWRSPKVKGVNPINKDFDTYEDWEDFVLFHELSHITTKRKKNQSLHDYENQINNQALDKMSESLKKQKDAWSNGNYLTRVWNRHQIESNPEAFKNFLINQLQKKYGTNEDVKSFTGLSVEQWKNSIDKSIVGILSSPADRLLYEKVIDPDARLGTYDRIWDWIDDGDLYSTDFVVKNFSSIAHQYMTGAVADTKFFKQFGTLSISEVEEKLREKMLRRFKGRDLNEEEKLRIERDLSNIRGSLERVRGIYMDKNSPLPGSIPQRVLDSAMKFNNIRLAAQFGIGSLTDIGRPIIFMGLSKGLGPLFKSFAFNNAKTMEVLGKANKELKAFMVGNEINQQILISSQTNVNMNEKTGTFLERIISDSNNAMFMSNGLSNWNQHIKRSVGVSVVNKIIENSMLLRSGKLPKEEMDKMLKLHLDKKDLQIIAKQFEEHGTSYKGVSLMNFENWDLDQTDQLDLFNRLSAGIRKEVDTIIVTPGMGDTPLIMENSFVKNIAQYRAFQIASMNRVLIPMTQQGVHPDLMIGILVSAQIGQAVDQYNAFVADRPYDAGNWAEQLWTALGDSAALGSFGLAADYANLASEANPFILGPTITGIFDASKGMGALGGQGTPSEERALQRMLPFVNLLNNFIRPIEAIGTADNVFAKEAEAVLNNNN